MGFFHTIFLSDGFRPVRALPLWKHPPGVWAIIKSRLCREAAKVGGGLWPPFENSSCRESKNRTVLHFRAKAAALRGAETIQHLGEICTAQCSRGKSKQDRQQVKARLGGQARLFPISSLILPAFSGGSSSRKPPRPWSRAPAGRRPPPPAGACSRPGWRGSGRRPRR